MRLIDADALKEKFKTCRNEYNGVMNTDGACAMIIAQRVLNDAPTIEAEPVKHGKWDNTTDSCRICNQCGVSIVLCDTCKDWTPLSYCPNCGAKMDGGV